MNLIKILTISILSVACFAGEAEKPKPPSVADQIFDKALADNTKDAEKQFDLYQKALAVATEKVLKSLEGAKADLNDTKKFTKLSISERAEAIKGLEDRVAKVKEGAIGELVAEKVAKKRGGDLLGGVEGDMAKAIVGKWKVNNMGIQEFFDDGGCASSSGNVGTWKMVGKGFEVTWRNSKDLISIVNKNKMTSTIGSIWIREE
jgi:hypothetical protein